MWSKKPAVRFVSALLVVLTLAFCVPFSVYADKESQSVFTDSPECTSIDTTVNGRLSSPGYSYLDTLWFSFTDLFRMLQGDYLIFFGEDGTVEVSGDDLYLFCSPDGYLCCNNRYVYLPNGFLTANEKLYLDCDTMEFLLNVRIAESDVSGCVEISAEEWSFPENGLTYYQQFSMEDLYWLCHIIHSEAGHSVLKGRLAVGNVVMNRVASDKFPNTIHEVIFDDKVTVQFQPVYEGNVMDTPDELSVVAAYLALENYNVVKDAVYFFEPYVETPWLEEDDFVCKIGYHLFYR